MHELSPNHSVADDSRVAAIIRRGWVKEATLAWGCGPEPGVDDETLYRLRNQPIQIKGYDAWLIATRHRGSTAPYVSGYIWYRVSVLGPEAERAMRAARSAELDDYRAARARFIQACKRLDGVIVEGGEPRIAGTRRLVPAYYAGDVVGVCLTGSPRRQWGLDTPAVKEWIDGGPVGPVAALEQI